MVDLAEQSGRMSLVAGMRSARRFTAGSPQSDGVCVPAALLIGAQPAAAFPLLQSTGSSFAGVAIDQWVGQASSLYGFNINFQVSSSVFGLNSFAQGQEDFAASDIPYSSGQADSTPHAALPVPARRGRGVGLHVQPQGVDGQQIKSLVLNAQTVGWHLHGQDQLLGRSVDQGHQSPPGGAQLAAHDNRARLPRGAVGRELPPVGLPSPSGWPARSWPISTLSGIRLPGRTVGNVADLAIEYAGRDIRTTAL